MSGRSRRSSGPIDPRLLRAVPTLRPHLAGLVALQVIGVLLTVAWAGLLATAIARVVVGHADTHDLLRTLLLLAVVGVARAAVAAVVEGVGRRASVRIRAELRRLAVTTVAARGPAWVQAQPPGRVATACGPGPEGVDGWVTRALPALVAAVVVPPVVGLRIALADGWSALVLIGLLPLVPVFMVLVGISTRERLARRYAVLALLSGRFLDVVQGLTTLRIYGRADDQAKRLRAATASYRRHTMAALRVGFLSGLALDLIATLSIAVVAVEIGLRLDSGSLTLSTALVVLLLAPELFAPLRAAGAQYHAAEEGRTAAAAVLDLVDDDATSGPVAVPVDAAAAGAVSWTGVTVRHGGRGAPALDTVDLDVAAGSVVVVEGRSGSGKSTLLATALGLVTPDAGRVTLGPGADRPAWVPQRPRPTQDTVGAEVALGDPSATAAEIDDALAACAALPAATALGEDGSAISAGQRRRVALARALLRARGRMNHGEVPLLLLDEPSEDLDAVTEQVVLDVVRGLAGRATVVIATHSERLAAVADRRVRLHAGRVVGDRTVAAPAVTPVISAARRPHPVAHREPSTVSPAAPARPEPRTSTRALVSSLRYRRRLVRAALLSGAAGLSGLALTATSLWLICRAAQHPSEQALALAVVGVRTFALARALLRYAERLVGHDAALRLLGDLRAAVFTRLVPLVPYGLGSARRGQVLRTFVTDVDGIQDGLVRCVIPWAGAAITALGAATLAAAFSPLAGAVLAATAAACLIVAPGISHAVAGAGQQAAALAGRRDGTALGLAEGLAELTVYDAIGATLARIDRLELTVGARLRRPTWAAAAGTFASGAALGVGLPLVVAAGVTSVGRGTSVLVVATLAACVIALADAVAPVAANSASWAGVLAGHGRVQRLLTRPVPAPEPLHPAQVPADALGVVASGVAVSPGPAEPAVVHDVSFDLRPGRAVAVVGPSGCGKSTLLGTVMRLNLARRGSLVVRGEDAQAAVADLGRHALPPRIAGSLQGDHVFDASLGDNLRVVRPGATDADLDRAAARAGLAPFVASLPAGWRTPAGPDGDALSGGQRQRLLLARAFLADPEILVLDEPTAHLDRDTADEVMRELLVATTGSTVLLSSHRALPPEADVDVRDLGHPTRAAELAEAS